MLKNAIRGFLIFSLVTLSISSLAEEIRDYYSEPGINPFKERANYTDNELIDTFSGALQLKYRDVFVPGNGGMDISIYRTYNSLQNNQYPTYSQYGVGWTMHMGRIVIPKAYEDRVCNQSGFVEATKDNPSLELPDGGRDLLVQIDANDNDLVTKNNWKMSCSSTSSSSLKTVISPDGTRYEMGHYEVYQEEPSWFTTKITDIHGNSIFINYNVTSNGQSYITDISRSEEGEAVVEFSYESINGSNLLASITANNQTIEYEYDLDKVPGFLVPAHNLIKVTRPDGKYWEYSYNGKYLDPDSNDEVDEDGLGSYSLNYIKLPSGATVNYEYQFVKFYKNYEKKTTSISKKIVNGPDIENGTWSYIFEPHSSDVLNREQGLLVDKTTIVGPYQKKVFHNYGADVNEYDGTIWRFVPALLGRLVQEDTFSLSGSRLEKRKYNWGMRKISDEIFWHAGPNDGDWFNITYAPVLLGEYITRDDSTDGYSRGVTYSNHDTYGNPEIVHENVNRGGLDFSEVTSSISYYNNTSSWVLGLISSELKTAGDQTINTSNTYDIQGNLLTSTVNGLTTTYTYHSTGDLASVEDPIGNITYFSNYKRGIAESEVHPEGVSISRSVNDTGTVASETNANGNVTTYRYDSSNRITSIEHPLNSKVSISYTSDSRTLTRGDFKQISNFDSLDRPVSETYSDENLGITIKKVFKYDALGRMTFESNPDSVNSSIGKWHEYDALGRRIKTTLQDGSIYRISYDDLDETHTDELGRETIYSYLSFGLGQGMLYQITQPESVSTLILRNMLGKPTKVFQGTVEGDSIVGWERNYTYDAQFRLISEEDPESGIRTYTYDDNWNLISETLASNSVKSFQYDGLDRLTSITYENDSSINYEYSLASEIKKIINGNSIRDYEYDENGNLTSESLQIGSTIYNTTYSYDTLDNLASMTYPTGRTVDYSPNAFGWATQALPFLTSVEYHPSGQLSNITYANGQQSNFTLSDRLWIDQIQTNSIFTHDYLYDAKGNVSQITATGLTPYNRVMTYDPLDRLESATGPWGTINYTYSAIGDITSNDNGVFNYSGVQLNNIEKDRFTTYFSYDGNGNVIDEQKISTFTIAGIPSITELYSRKYFYDDAENLIRSNSLKQGQSLSSVTDYQYDGKGNRIKKYNDNTSTDFVYSDAGLLLGEYVDGNLEYGKDLIYLGSQLVTSIQKNQKPTSSVSVNDLLVVENKSTTLIGSANDPDGENLTYLWTQVSGALAVINEPNLLSSSVIMPSISNTETLVFKLTVTDSDDESHSSTVSIQVISDDYDSEGDNMFDAWELEYFGTTDRNGSGDFDNDGHTDAEEFANGTDPTVANQWPTANAGEDIIAISGDLVNLSGILSSDSDGNIANYQWTQVSGVAVVLSNTTSANASFTAPIVTGAATLQFKLVVTDNGFGTGEDNVNVTVISETYDSDSDGIADAWEIRMFGDTSRDGSLDSDNDGISDLNEFIAGSNPNDAAPTVQITEHTTEPEILSSTAYFIKGEALDLEDGDLSTSIQWSSDLMGSIGTGKELSVYLTDGIHIISATVLDSENGQPSNIPSVTITVLADTDGDELPDTWETQYFGTLDYNKLSDPDEDGISNIDEYMNGTNPMDQAPSISILAPTNGSLQLLGNAFALVAEVIDREDGNISHQVTWTSHIDGPLGSGSILPVNLSEGAHELEAHIIDSQGGENVAYIDVNVTADGCLPSNSNNVRHQYTLFNNGLDTPSLAASFNGQHVLFYTGVDNALEGDSNGNYDLYLLDQMSGQEELISKTYTGVSSNNVPRDLSISNDGSIISFSSEASDLVANDTNGIRDVFYRNRITNETKRASVDASGNELVSANGSFGNVVSGDGQKIAFFTNTDIDSKDKYGWFDVYLKDLETGSIELVSLDENGNHQFSNYDFYYLACSDDCGVVAFSGTAAWASTDTNGTFDLYVRDRNTGTTEQISKVPNGSSATFGSFVPAMSANGQIIVYQSEVNGLVAGDQNNLKDIFAYDRQTAITTLISKNSAGEAANNASFKPSVSADGRYISFESLATNLDSDLPDTNAQADVFVHDRQLGTTQRLSKDWQSDEGQEDIDSNTGQPRSAAFNPYIFRDGSEVLYRTSIDITQDADYWGWNLFTSTLPMCLSGNTAPIVKITAPSAPQAITLGSAIEFTAQAIDNEDGDLSTNIVWASSIDGSLGTGATVSVTLSEGVHTISASITDNEGLEPEFEATLQITVTQGGAQ
jgi:YD repeat-containing protein